MTLGDLWSAAVQYGPWVVTTASAAAALIPASAVNANPALKTLTAIIDLLALNVGKAKDGPPPFAVMKEIATGDPAPQRD